MSPEIRERHLRLECISFFDAQVQVQRMHQSFMRVHQLQLFCSARIHSATWVFDVGPDLLVVGPKCGELFSNPFWKMFV